MLTAPRSRGLHRMDTRYTTRTKEMLIANAF